MVWARECFYFVFSLPFSDLYWKVWLRHNLPAGQRGTMSKWPAALYDTASSLAGDNNRSEKMMSAQNGDKVWSFSQNLHLVSCVVWRFFVIIVLTQFTHVSPDVLCVISIVSLCIKLAAERTRMDEGFETCNALCSCNHGGVFKNKP